MFRRLVCLVIHCANMAPATFERDRARARLPGWIAAVHQAHVLLSPNFLAFGLRLCRKRRRAKAIDRVVRGGGRWPVNFGARLC